MNHFLLDIETTPLPEDQLLKLMPPEILNPPQVDLSDCPKYNGDLAKQDAWKKKETDAHFLKCASEKQRWLGDAALHAPRGKVKVIGIRDVAKGITECFLVDVLPAEQKLIEAVKTWPCKVKFAYLSEKIALDIFHSFVEKEIDRGEGTLVGYYISGFDFRFLLRRAMILGAKVCKKLCKGPRYFNDDLYIDLDEVYKCGERELKIGGLDGLAQILGVKRKTGDGENFGSTWIDDPVEAINYHLNEMDTIEQCAKKMGVI